jgi:hypothetical protein
MNAEVSQLISITMRNDTSETEHTPNYIDAAAFPNGKAISNHSSLYVNKNI